MSETTEDGLTDEMLLEVFEHWANNDEAQRTKRVTPKGVLKLVSLARESLQLRAQLTEVTRERDELLRQRNSYPSDFDPSLRQHERDVTEIVELRAALASLRVVVEAAKAFSAAWLRWSRSNAIGVNVVTIDAAHTLCEALDALHADPSAPTLKEW